MTTHAMHKLGAVLLAVVLVSGPTRVADAFTVLGTGDGALLDNDLTDLGDNGSEGSYSDPNANPDPLGDVVSFGNFDAEFFANREFGFGGGEFSFNVFDNRTGGGNNKVCCGGGWPYIIGADFSNTLATGTQLIQLERFTLTSSNDSPQRDPDRWSIQGSTDTTTGLDGTWTTIYEKTSGSRDWSNTRNQVLAYGAVDGDTFLTTDGFKTFRLNATASGGGTDFALGEMEFFGTIFLPTTAGTPLFWDGDNGNWTTPDWLDDVPGTGSSTGDYPRNVADVVNPANITEGTVTVNSDEEAYSLTMDTGTNGSGGRPGDGILNITSNTLSINTEATIANTSAVNISPGATLDVGGTLQIDPTATFSNSGTANAGSLAGTGTATLDGGSLLSAGGGSLGAITLTGNAEVETLGNVTVGALNAAGSVLTKSGPGTLDVTGNTTLPGTATHNVAAGTLRFSGQVNESAAAGIIKDGAGILELANNNGYTGQTSVNDGVVSVSNAGGLGTTSSGTVVNDGGSLRLTGGGNFNISEPLTLNGGGAALSDGALHSEGNDHDINGPVTLGSNATVRKDGGGNLEFRGGGSGGIDTAGFELRVEAANTIRVYDNGISGSGTLRKEENGTLEIRTNQTGYTGTVNIVNGYVDLDNRVDPLGSGTVNVSGDGTLRLRNGVTVPNDINISTDGEGTAGAIRNENNTNTVTGPVTSTNNASRIHLNSGQLNLTNTLALNNDVNVYGNGTLNVTGQVTGGGDLNKNDGGTTILANGTNTFSGTLNVNGGTVNVTSASALGAPKDASVASGATLNLAGGSLNDLVVNGDANTSANLGVSNLTVNSTSLQAGPNLVNVSNSMKLGGTAYTVNSGDIDVSGTVSRNRPQTLILNNANVTVTTPSVPVGHPTAGLLGVWTFDDGTATDLSGNGHDGILINSPTISNADLYHPGAGLSLNTNGGNRAVVIGGNENDFDVDTITIAAWVKERPDGNWETYIAKRGENNKGYQLRRRSSSSNFGWTIRGTSGTDDPQGSFPLGDNNGSGGWIHAVARYDGTRRDLIVNGNTASPDISIADTGNIANGPERLTFGARQRNNQSGTAEANLEAWSHVKLDDIFIYDRALTDAEVATIYNGGAALPRATTFTAVIDNLAGTGTIDATGTAGLEITNSVAPGSSIGILTVAGDLLFDGSYFWELGPEDAIPVNDQIAMLGGDLDLGTWTLDILDAGGQPRWDDQFYLFTGFGSLVSGLGNWTISADPARFNTSSAVLGVDAEGVFITGLLGVPEPSTLGLLSLAAMALVLVRRRR